MANEIELSKLIQTVATGPTSAQVTASKLVMYVILEPGTEAGASPPVHHAFTYGQRFNFPGQ